MVIELNDANFEAEVIEKGGVALVDFGASWCGPCRSLAPRLEKLSDEYEGKARFYKLDIEESEKTAQKHDIMYVPTIVFFKNGERRYTIVGAKPDSVLIDQIDKLL